MYRLLGSSAQDEGAYTNGINCVSNMYVVVELWTSYNYAIADKPADVSFNSPNSVNSPYRPLKISTSLF